MKNSDSKHDLLLGLIVGGTVGALAAYFITTKLEHPLIRGIKVKKDIKHYIKDIYDDVTDRTVEFIESFNEKSQEAREVLSKKAAGWADHLGDIVEQTGEEVKDWACAIKDAATKARSQALALGRDPHHQDKIVDIMNWADRAFDLADQVSREVKNWSESINDFSENTHEDSKPIFIDESEKSSKHSLSEVMEWAILGMNIWNNLRDRKSHR